ncbi:unnamed protein product [Chironomus riparius]|uniref:Uncharacterized protein n=1 Tax=Chironomus riparius TaxID=315576 RepID=A0A9N9S4M3_9DIPT|nr:unnamed protein product [Chironomus riparius]
MKIISILVLLSLQIYTSHSSSYINCIYNYHFSEALGVVYQCVVVTSLDYDSKNHEIYTDYNPINNQVFGFVANYKYLQYFPKGVDRIFKNLQLIHLRKNSIKTVNYRDLSPYPELKEIDLAYNLIEVVDDLFFRASPKLEFLSLTRNKIFHIDARSFDGLHNLRFLHLYANPCIDMDAHSNRNEVLNITMEARTSCTNQKYLDFSRKLEQIESASSSRPPTEIQRILYNFEHELNSSQLANVWVLRERVNNIQNRVA